MKGLIYVGGIGAGLALSSASVASDRTTAQSAVVAAPVAGACEVHVWPAARVGATTMGAGASFGLIGGLIDAAAHAKQNKRDQAFITSALDPQSQAKVIREANLPELLAMPDARIVMHDQGIDYKTDNPKRLDSSPASCYYDFVVRSLGYLKTATTHGKMRTWLAIRGFRGDHVVTNYKDSANDALDISLPKEGQDVGPATDALAGAFKADVTRFAQKYMKKTNGKPKPQQVAAR